MNAPSLFSLAGGLESLRRLVLAGVVGSVLVGCATGPNTDPRDPLEPMNRRVSGFNQTLDAAVVRPVAETYRDVTHPFVRSLIGNFFGNLSDIWATLNTALQMRGEDAASNLMRVSINTFLGLGGVLDVATEAGLYKNPADFGQTLGYWGVPPGPYLVLPVLGPSTVRDAAGMGVESSGDRVMSIDHIPSRNSLYALRLVQTRASLLKTGDLLQDAALDPYTFNREAFLARRQSLIEDQRHRHDDDDDK